MGKRFFLKKTSKEHISIEKSIEVDKYKDAQAKQHGLDVVRINADKSDIKFLSENIHSAFSDIFDLQDVNWYICDMYATKNIVKDVCEYYENHKPKSVLTIANELSMKYATVQKYLKKGHILGWCNYDLKEVEKMRRDKCTKSNIDKFSKMVLVYDIDNNFIKSYSSVSECDRNSIADFGTKLNGKNISSVAIGKRKTYKGFIFKYTNTN